jgi:hypothetical protein
MLGQHYEMNEALQTAGMEFYYKGIFKLPEWWEKCVHRNGDYVKKSSCLWIKMIYLVFT